MFLNKVLLCLIIINVSTTIVLSKKDEGEPCTIAANSRPGDCLPIANCPSALAEIDQGKTPETCGFREAVPLVCCEKEVANKEFVQKEVNKEVVRQDVVQEEVVKEEVVNKQVLQQEVVKKQVVERLPGVISQQKCYEYSGSAYELDYPQTNSFIRIKVNTSVCGFTVTPLIIGGVKAVSKEFPHMALLGYKEEPNKIWKCGGSLISEQYVMTAGHCVFSMFGKVKWVRLGDLNIKTDTDDAAPVEFAVAERITHPDFLPPSRYNDIALVKLNSNVKFNRYIRPACLATAPVPDEKFLASGWGLVERDGSNLSDDLRKVILNKFSITECNSTYENAISARTLRYGIVPDTQLCAGGRDEEKDTCQGDSGGPLQIYNKEEFCMYTIVGVTSFGKSCGIKNVPGIYTNVPHYIKWLEDTIWPPQ